MVTATIKEIARRQLIKRGYLWTAPPNHEKFHEQARQIIRHHKSQTVNDVNALNSKFSQPVFGDVLVWDLILKLSMVCDPSDPSLGCTSQLLHALQVTDAMEKDRIDDPYMLVAALTHDLGKLLLLTGEPPENVVCMNEPIGSYQRGIGLENCVFQWNHDEFIYSRLKEHVPEHVAWLLRYHSIYIDQCDVYMDSKDREYTERYLRPFQHYDQAFKSPYALTDKSINEYKDLIFDHFPEPIKF